MRSVVGIVPPRETFSPSRVHERALAGVELPDDKQEEVAGVEERPLNEPDVLGRRPETP